MKRASVGPTKTNPDHTSRTNWLYILLPMYNDTPAQMGTVTC